jgi:hypothetical protein
MRQFGIPSEGRKKTMAKQPRGSEPADDVLQGEQELTPTSSSGDTRSPRTSSGDTRSPRTSSGDTR